MNSSCLDIHYLRTVRHQRARFFMFGGGCAPSVRTKNFQDFGGDNCIAIAGLRGGVSERTPTPESRRLRGTNHDEEPTNDSPPNPSIRGPDFPCYGAPPSNSPGERRFSVENFEISPGGGWPSTVRPSPFLSSPPPVVHVETKTSYQVIEVPHHTPLRASHADYPVPATPVMTKQTS